LLKLKKLQILGFKSFCDRTELKFHGDGVAAIVGPNGCGKSNISDAISWVLGEQSAKSLRGARMEDVIFIGTRDRKPTGMAEVSLTLIDPSVYDGPVDLTAEPEIEVVDEVGDDWDEAALREQAQSDMQTATEDAQPGKVLNEEEVAAAQAAGVELDEQELPEVAPLGEESVTSDFTSESASESGEQTQSAPGGVVLKIRRRKFAQKVHQGEIVVTRRLFRTGESEYLLNGKLCRLRDIQDIFMGTGLGPESYAIIEQGRIGQILSSKPHDRRAIIEEAAGVTKFKTRRRLAESRLEAAKVNLNRINDIFDEVTRQMNSLKRQSAKAERYAKLRDEMRAKLRIVLASKFVALDLQLADADLQLNSLAEEITGKSAALADKEAEHSARTHRGYSIEEETRSTNERLTTITLELDRAAGRRQHNQERCAELDARTAAATAEIAATEQQVTSLRTELETNQGIVASAAADVQAAQLEAGRAQQAATLATALVSDTETQQEERRRHMLQVISLASTVRNEMVKSEELVSALDREAARITQELTTATAQIESFGGRRGQLSMEFETVSERLTGLKTQVEQTRSTINEKRAAESEGKKRLDTLRAEFATALGKRGSLEALIAEHGYSTASVQRLFQSGAMKQQGHTPAGVLADFLEVENQYEHVVEEFLRDELNYIVVKSWDAADEGLRLLQGDVDGRATFLVHPNDSQARFSFNLDESTRSAPRRDAVIPVKSAIKVLDGFGKSLEVILPKLRDGYITPDSSTARDLALGNPDAFFLSPSGECFHNVTVTGGKQRSEGPLSLKRELRELMKSIGEMEQQLRADESRVTILGREITELSELLVRLEADLREAEVTALTSGHALQQLESEVKRIGERLHTYQAELDRVKAERSQAEEAIAIRREELAKHESQRIELEAQTTAAQENLAALKTSRDQAAAIAGQMTTRVAALDERRIAAEASLQRIQSMVSEISARIAGLQTQNAAAAAEKLQREAESVELLARGEALAQESQQLKAKAAELQLESEQLRSGLLEMEAALKQLRAELDAARDRKGELAATSAKLRSDAEYMAENCRNELGLGREELLADGTIARVEGESLAQEDALYREMRDRLDAMGPVNMMALEEYKETADRHAFLETQRKDLLDSIENTQKTIKEIDDISREKFEQAFHQINETFQLTFRKLFGGGHAFMRLTDEENSPDSGIDVIAQPPGKKLQNVLLLSGGEKALTALSLLVGIFQYQPSPFCVLDEVDAPLDEANVGRFAEMVKEMAIQTQFVIITHNKKTMSIAPVMYGVTMQEPGVSKVISVRFGDEQKAASA
jgi:chromosome segregation protein